MGDSVAKTPDKDFFFRQGHYSKTVGSREIAFNHPFEGIVMDTVDQFVTAFVLMSLKNTFDSFTFFKYCSNFFGIAD